MFDKLKRTWRELKSSPPGERFETHHKKQKERRTSKWQGVASLAGAIVSLAIGVVLVFIPGPAILFFFLGGGLLASHSLWVAKGLDWTELKLRAGFEKARTWWRSHSWAARVPVVLAAAVVVLGVGLAAFEAFTGKLSR